MLGLDSLASILPVDSAVLIGNQLESFVVNGETLLASNLVAPTLTSFRASSSTVYLVGDGQAVPASGSRAALLTDDFRLDTGILNATAGNNSMGISFGAGLINRPGPDVVLFELNPSTQGKGDGFLVLINGIQLQVLNTAYGPSVGQGTSMDLYARSQGSPTTLADLESGTPAINNPSITQDWYGVTLDFSDFGVAPGASVTSFSMGSDSANTNGTFDPVLLMGISTVPEPGSFALMLLGIGLLRWPRTR